MPGQEYAGFDLIGDVHGCAEALVALLERLGYTRRGGSFQYRDQRRPRQAIFLGDLIDRGDGIRETVLLVQEMADRGHARVILGNHEYHALAYSTLVPDPEGKGEVWLRSRSERATRQLEATLAQFAHHPRDWRDALAWFAQLPLWLEWPGLRVVHACWDERLIKAWYQRYGSEYLSHQALLDTADRHGLAFRCVDRLTRGIDLALPNGLSMTSADGVIRRGFRAKFWVADPATYGDVQFQPDPLPEGVAELSLPREQRTGLAPYGPDQRPLFFGHYWQSGHPQRLAPNLACLDYSAVRGGRLVAYRFEGEQSLDNHRFVWVDGLGTPLSRAWDEPLRQGHDGRS